MIILYITYKVDTKYDGIHKMIEDDKKPISFTPEEKEKILMLMDTEKNVTIKQNNSVEINNKKVNV